MNPISVAILASFVIGALVFFTMFVSIYNALVSLRKQVDRAWSNIDVVLKQRFEEIPKIVQVIEQFVQYEREIIGKLIEARQHYGQATTVGQKIQASTEFSLAMRGVIAIGENYPELKSNAQFVQLQKRISDLEGLIADRRELYNDSATNLNTRIEQFPDLFFARLLRYDPVPLYRAEIHEREAPSLKMKLSA